MKSVEVCRELGAEDRGTLIQKDTYFEVRQGRLKLREESDAGAHLIAYERPDLPGLKESSYQLIEVREAAELQSTLAAVLGIGAIVKKTRRLFIFEGARIHLDRVDDLGNFIEFEGSRLRMRIRAASRSYWPAYSSPSASETQMC